MSSITYNITTNIGQKPNFKHYFIHIRTQNTKFSPKLIFCLFKHQVSVVSITLISLNNISFIMYTSKIKNWCFIRSRGLDTTRGSFQKYFTSSRRDNFTKIKYFTFNPKDHLDKSPINKTPKCFFLYPTRKITMKLFLLSYTPNQPFDKMYDMSYIDTNHTRNRQALAL